MSRLGEQCRPSKTRGLVCRQTARDRAIWRKQLPPGCSGDKNMHNNSGQESPRHENASQLLRWHTGGEKELSWRQRIQSDFRLGMLTLFSVCACLIIMPFGVYRFWTGDYLIGFADLLIVVGFVCLMTYAWKTDKSALVGNITAVFASVATLTMLVFLELNHSWIFATLVANFLLATRRVAIIVSAVVILVVSYVLMRGAMPTLELATIISVSVLMSLFALIFASRVDSQHHKLSELAALDPLTGAANRRMLKVDMESGIDAARQGAASCTLAVMDLDHFKQVNDRHGHQTGDQVLMDFARIVQQSMRRTDRLYRYGGEEFVLLLPQTPAHSAGLALEKLLVSIRSRLKSPDGPVTVSIGVATLRAGEEAADLLNRADAALYQAKESGRDCLVLAPDADADPSETAREDCRRKSAPR